MKRTYRFRHSVPFLELAMLGFEANQVIMLRLMKLGLGGPSANQEAVRMVTEKFAAAALAGRQMALGQPLKTVVGGYRKKVRANARRLSKTHSIFEQRTLTDVFRKRFHH